MNVVDGIWPGTWHPDPASLAHGIRVGRLAAHLVEDRGPRWRQWLAVEAEHSACQVEAMLLRCQAHPGARCDVGLEDGRPTALSAFGEPSCDAVRLVECHMLRHRSFVP